MSEQQSGRRGLYVTLVALVVLGALVGVGIHMRGRSKASEASVSTQPEAPPPSLEPAAPTPPPEEPAPAVANRPSPEELARRRLLAELEHRLDSLSGRAAVVNSSLDRLQQQQAAAGYGLRGDMASRWATMQANLSKAQNAVVRGDATKAKRYVDLSASDVEALEHFLGR